MNAPTSLRTTPAAAARAWRPWQLAWLMAGAGLLAGASAQAQSVTNGGFEGPAVADGSYVSTPATGWTGGALLMNPDAAGQFAGNPSLWPQAHSGAQYADIGNTPGTAMSQAVAFASAGSFVVGWADNTALGLPVQFHTSPYVVALLNGAQQVVASGNFDAWHADGQWQTRALAATVAAGTYTLRFTSQNVAFSADTLVDTVSVSAVPEAPTVALLLLGIAGLRWRCLRRRDGR
jgi:hypothetical protein